MLPQLNESVFLHALVKGLIFFYEIALVIFHLGHLFAFAA